MAIVEGEAADAKFGGTHTLAVPADAFRSRCSTVGMDGMVRTEGSHKVEAAAVAALQTDEAEDSPYFMNTPAETSKAGGCGTGGIRGAASVKAEAAAAT